MGRVRKKQIILLSGTSKSSNYLSDGQVPQNNFYGCNTLSLSNFIVANIVDKYKNIRTSRCLGYLSFGQVEICLNLEPCEGVPNT